MVRFTVLGSGSKGNATVITSGKTSLLVDCGFSCREILRRMREAGEDPEKLSGIIVTHEHADHVSGISVTARKLKIPVYFTEGTHKAWKSWIEPSKQMSRKQWLEECQRRAEARLTEGSSVDISSEEPSNDEDSSRNAADKPAKHEASWLPAVEYFEAGEEFSIGDLKVRAFTTPHDAADPVGFVFEAEGVRMGYATDLGYMPPNVKAQLTGLDLLLLESNHDLEMLRDGPYPWSVKQRVMSRVGHLSNDAAAEFLASEYDGQARQIILAHLSEKNNLPELARIAAERALAERMSLTGNQLQLAGQYAPLTPLYF